MCSRSRQQKALCWGQEARKKVLAAPRRPGPCKVKRQERQRYQMLYPPGLRQKTCTKALPVWAVCSWGWPPARQVPKRSRAGLLVFRPALGPHRHCLSAVPRQNRQAEQHQMGMRLHPLGRRRLDTQTHLSHGRILGNSWFPSIVWV